ncbi:hypothetical protein [Streptomyces sp. NPDC020681]|uniref:hypothetical protein n=1 Tax=Streptomyces sp. NPDC020681 TaxID=3365083 RepID=UPI0037A1DAF8
MDLDVSYIHQLRQVVALADDGRFTEAIKLAVAFRSEAVRLNGTRSPQAVRWIEAEAHTAYLAGDVLRSSQVWMSAAMVRLARGESGYSAEVEAAVDRAHHQWQQLSDPYDINRLAPELVALRIRVPGRQFGALEAVRRRSEVSVYDTFPMSASYA